MDTLSDYEVVNQVESVSGPLNIPATTNVAGIAVPATNPRLPFTPGSTELKFGSTNIGGIIAGIGMVPLIAIVIWCAYRIRVNKKLVSGEEPSLVEKVFYPDTLSVWGIDYETDSAGLFD